MLVRHGSHAELGRVLSGRSGIALDPRGRAEAEALTRGLEGTPIASLHASPRRRALETIEPLAEQRGLAVRVAPALDEIDFGSFDGREFAALDGNADWERWNAERATARCPGGETMAEAIARAVGYLLDLSAEDFPALCVTHCDIIRGIVAEQTGSGLGAMFAFDCEPASVTTLAIEDGKLRLVSINQRFQ